MQIGAASPLTWCNALWDASSLTAHSKQVNLVFIFGLLHFVTFTVGNKPQNSFLELVCARKHTHTHTPSLLQCLSGFSQTLEALKSFSQFKDFFLMQLFVHKHAVIVWKETLAHKPDTGRHSELQTKCLQSARRRFKMADCWSCVCVCVCGNRAECFLSTEKSAASQRRIHTDVK